MKYEPQFATKLQASRCNIKRTMTSAKRTEKTSKSLLKYVQATRGRSKVIRAKRLDYMEKVHSQRRFESKWKKGERKLQSVNSGPTLFTLIRQFSEQEMKENNKVEVLKDIMNNETVLRRNVIRKTFENPIIMKNFVDLLNVGDFCRWYDSCEVFQDIFDKMDESIWRGLTNNLLLILGIEDKNFLDEQFHEKSFKNIFQVLRKCAEYRVKKVKRKFHLYKTYYIYPTDEDIAGASILAHHGLLGPIRELDLWNLDLSLVRTQNLGSLVASVTETVNIDKVTNIDLSPILDKIECEVLTIRHPLSNKERQALLRAMETRVTAVSLHAEAEDEAFDIETLTTYDGKGKCMTVFFRDKFFLNFDQIVRWAKKINWEVKRTKECIRCLRKLDEQAIRESIYASFKSDIC